MSPTEYNREEVTREAPYAAPVADHSGLIAGSSWPPCLR